MIQNTGKSPWSATAGAMKAGVMSGAEKDGLNNSEKVDFCVLFPPLAEPSDNPSPTQNEINDSFWDETKPNGLHIQKVRLPASFHCFAPRNNPG